MPRPTKKLSDYPKPPFGQVDENEFDKSISSDNLLYTCVCGLAVKSKKRFIAARLLRSFPLLCPSCRNKENNRSSVKEGK